MKTIAEFEHDILQITMKIHAEYPELSKYINEMSVKYSEMNTEVINSRGLEEYYDSLVEVLKEYKKTHPKLKESKLLKKEYVTAINQQESEDEENIYYKLSSNDNYIKNK